MENDDTSLALIQVQSFSNGFLKTHKCFVKKNSFHLTFKWYVSLLGSKWNVLKYEQITL